MTTENKERERRREEADAYFRDLKKPPVSPTRILRESSAVPLRVSAGYYDLKFDPDEPSEKSATGEMSEGDDDGAPSPSDVEFRRRIQAILQGEPY